jgi:hypothetical protein
LIDDVLGGEPTWEPPPGFEQAVASRAVHMMRVEQPHLRWSWSDVVHGATAGVTIGTFGWLAGYMLNLAVPRLATTVSMPPGQWACVAAALVVAAWFTQRDRAMP